MKKLITITLLVLSVASLAADKTVLTCSTAGDAIDAVEFVVTSGKNEVRVSHLNDTVDTYKTDRTFKNIAAKDSDTIIATGKDSYAFGGALSDAILIRVFKGAKSARMSLNGSVLFLNCFE